MIESKTFMTEEEHRMIVIGVGNAGNHVVNRMVDQGIGKVEFIGVNTDQRSLYDCKAPKLLLINTELINKTGAESNPEIGEKAAWECAGEISIF